MKNKLNKTAGLTALFIGIMSVTVGILVITKISVPDYNFHLTLVIYNVVAGIISIFCAILIFKEHKYSLKLSIFIFCSHFIVLLLISTVYLDIIANKSIKAMIFRTLVWLFIILFQIRKTKTLSQSM
ncbi:MAG: hypothetical protein OEZ22_08760 [Spirochaetia bacterium]|nr:hypothetical protein [Spirochaetia bacterium]